MKKVVFQNLTDRIHQFWKLIHSEPFQTSIEARQRENWYKRGIGSEKIKEFHNFKAKDS